MSKTLVLQFDSSDTKNRVAETLEEAGKQASDADNIGGAGNKHSTGLLCVLRGSGRAAPRNQGRGSGGADPGGGGGGGQGDGSGGGGQGGGSGGGGSGGGGQGGGSGGGGGRGNRS